MLTFSGERFSLASFANYPFQIEEIAHSLSMTCRFNGHTDEFYSVAQHSVLVAELVHPAYKIHALLHDAAEAYVGDTVRPLKDLFPKLTEIENEIQTAILRKHNVPKIRDVLKEIEKADKAVLLFEMADLFSANRNNSIRRTNRIIPQTPYEAKENFLAAYGEFKHGS